MTSSNGLHSLAGRDAGGLCESFHKFGLRGRVGVRTLLSTVRPMLASALFLTLSLGFSACGPRVTNRNIDALNRQYDSADKAGKGLSIKEVEAILGQPTRSQSFPIEMQTTKDLHGVRYYYEEDGKTVVLHFIDNKLIRRADRFGDPLPEDADLHLMTPKPEK